MRKVCAHMAVHVHVARGDAIHLSCYIHAIHLSSRPKSKVAPIQLRTGSLTLRLADILREMDLFSARHSSREYGYYEQFRGWLQERGTEYHYE